MKWVIQVFYLFRMADDTRHSDTVGFASDKRKLDVNHAYIYSHSFSKGKGSFVSSRTFTIFFKACKSSMLWCKATMSFLQHLMQRFELNLVCWYCYN